MLKILGRNNSSNVQKVLWAVEEIGIDYEREDYGGVFGKTKDDAYLSMNPNSVVPTIVDGDFVLWESNACVRYLCAKHSRGNLCPDDPQHYALCDKWMDWQQTTVGPPITPVFWGLIRTEPEDRDHDLINKSRDALEVVLQRMDNHLASSEFMGGDRFTMADIPLGIMVYRWFTLDIERKEMTNLSRWYESLTARKPFEKTIMIGLT